MCLCLYALLLRMLVIDLHAKNQVNICKHLENKKAKMALDRSPEFLRLPSHFVLSLSEKNLQEFLYFYTVQVAPIH